MKKLFLVVVVACLLVVGCGKNYDPVYNDNGQKVKEYYFNDSGDYDGYGVFEYDDNGNEVKLTFYNSKDIKDKVMIIEYDADGNKTRAIYYYYDETGELTNTYDSGEL